MGVKMQKYLIDKKGNCASIDTTSQALVSVSHQHRNIHEGNVFFRRGSVTLDGSETHNYLIITPSTRDIHFTFEISFEYEVQINIKEGAAVSANGAAVACYNRNRNSSTLPLCLICETPTITNTGTTFMDDHQGSGKKAGNSLHSSELILKRGTHYIVSITNITSNDNAVSWMFDWSEEGDEYGG